jgi:Flp pilus assembly pilin Flp
MALPFRKMVCLIYTLLLTTHFLCAPNFGHDPRLETSTEGRNKECTMKFSFDIKRFSRDEDGAVTVDWVVLTAAIVGLAVVAFTQIDTATNDMIDGIVTDLGGTPE